MKGHRNKALDVKSGLRLPHRVAYITATAKTIPPLTIWSVSWLSVSNEPYGFFDPVSFVPESQEQQKE